MTREQNIKFAEGLLEMVKDDEEEIKNALAIIDIEETDFGMKEETAVFLRDVLETAISRLKCLKGAIIQLGLYWPATEEENAQ